MTVPSLDAAIYAAIDPRLAALLIIDMQNYCAHPNGGWWREHQPTPAPPAPPNATGNR